MENAWWNVAPTPRQAGPELDLFPLVTEFSRDEKGKKEIAERRRTIRSNPRKHDYLRGGSDGRKIMLQTRAAKSKTTGLAPKVTQVTHAGNPEAEWGSDHGLVRWTDAHFKFKHATQMKMVRINGAWRHRDRPDDPFLTTKPLSPRRRVPERPSSSIPGRSRAFPEHLNEQMFWNR